MVKIKNGTVYAGKKYTKCFENRSGLSFQSHLTEWKKFQTEEKIYECNQVEKSIKTCSSVLSLQRFPLSVKTNICSKYGKVIVYPSLHTQQQKTNIRGKLYNCNDCGLLAIFQSLLAIREFILSRDLTNVMSAVKHLNSSQTSQDIRESTLERNHINVIYVTRS